MCVIIIKKRGVELPSERELRTAFNHNPHGCGFVSSSGFYWRGMDFDEFYYNLTKVDLDENCIIHFRLATHGSHKPSNCHPFKSGDIYFAHNGVLPVHTSKDMTDSETAFRNIFVPAAGLFGFGSPQFNDVIRRNIYSSKFAFMVNGDVKLYGRWIREDDGLIWSNLYHRPYNASYGGYSTARAIYL